jgi:hypothetical protein
MRGLSLLIVVCALFGCSGCTVFGLAVGSVVPRWDRAVPVDGIAAFKEKGEPLDVTVVLSRAPGDPPDQPPTRVLGSYVGLTAKELLLVTPEGRRAVPRLDVQCVAVGTGSDWAAGLGIGFLADVLTAGLVVFYFASSRTSPGY